MTTMMNEYNHLRNLYIQTGDERILCKANALAKEMLRVSNRKEKVMALALNALRIATLAIGLYLIVWASANLVRTFEFKLVYALEICFISFLCSCGIDWLQARMKKA